MVNSLRGLFWIAIASLSAWAGIAVADIPQSVSLEYRISKAGITIGTVREAFVREAGHYRISSETKTAGPVRVFLKDKLTITSEGSVGPGGLIPERYTFQRERDSQKNLVSVFDWPARQIVASVGGGGRQEAFELPEGTLDRISAMYQFMFQAPKAASVVAWMSQGKKAERYEYRRVGEESISIDGREFKSVRYARVARPGESHAELWLAADLHFLPVKMVFSDDKGLKLEQSLVSVSLQ